jgi:sensor histidine kinase YesM
VAPTQTFLTYGLHLLGLLTLGRVPVTAAGAWLEARRGAFLVISLTGLWKYAVVVGLYYAFEYHHRFRQQEREGDRLAVRTAELETRLAQARLDALRMQLHPHFLFNTLNSILVLNGEDPDRANRMLLRLSDLLRTVLETDDPEVGLGRELAIARQYLDIQRVRYEERLTVDLEIEPEARSARVPAFLLQPLIENAIRHGVERSATANRIRISASRRDGVLRIEVENRIPAGAGEVRGRGGGRGIGLANTRERLEQAYGSAGRLEAAAGPDGASFLVRIEVPFERFAEE